MRALILSLALVASPALASPNLDVSGDYLLGGVDLGGTFDSGGLRGGLFGVELSVTRIDSGSGFWWGGLAAAAWDDAIERPRFTLGPEIGWAMVGTEVGVSVDGDGAIGGRARLVFTVAVAALYIGSSFDGDGARGEFGVLLKVPWQFSRPSRR